MARVIVYQLGGSLLAQALNYARMTLDAETRSLAMSLAWNRERAEVAWRQQDFQHFAYHEYIVAACERELVRRRENI